MTLTQKPSTTCRGTVERDAPERGDSQCYGNGSITVRHYMLGRYDFVAIDLPSDEPVAKVLIEVGKSGTNNTRAMTALLPEQAGRAVNETG